MTPEVICLVLLATIAGMALVAEFFWPGLPRVNQAAGEYLISYPVTFRAWCLFHVFFFPVMYTSLMILNPPDQLRASGVLLMSGVFGLCTLLAAWNTLEAMRFLVVSLEGVKCHSPYKAPRFLRWREVRDITASRNHHAVLHAADGWRFRALGGSPVRVWLGQCRLHCSFAAIAAACYTPRKIPFAA